MERGVVISLDPATGKWTQKTVGVGQGSGSEHEREEVEMYQNWKYNGRMEVQDFTGKVKVYEDGCHIVERPEAYGIIQGMSNEEYEEFTGRPGSGNED